MAVITKDTEQQFWDNLNKKLKPLIAEQLLKMVETGDYSKGIVIDWKDVK